MHLAYETLKVSSIKTGRIKVDDLIEKSRFHEKRSVLLLEKHWTLVDAALN